MLFLLSACGTITAEICCTAAALLIRNSGGVPCTQVAFSFILLAAAHGSVPQLLKHADQTPGDAMQHLREQAGAEKGLLAQLAASSAVHLEPGSTYALLPRPWLAAWRTYIGATGKRGTLSDVRRPQPLPEAVAETFCSCHAFQAEQPERPVHLNIPPPSIVRRWALVQAAVISDVSLCSSRQRCASLSCWHYLCLG